MLFSLLPVDLFLCTRKIKLFFSKTNGILGQIQRSLTRAEIGITI